jgi:hypothetical protein
MHPATRAIFLLGCLEVQGIIEIVEMIVGTATSGTGTEDLHAKFSVNTGAKF